MARSAQRESPLCEDALEVGEGRDQHGDIVERLSASHIPWRKCAENLFQVRGYDDPALVAVHTWLKSPGHTQNMFDLAMTQTGVGVAIQGRDTVLIVQDFIRPPDAPPKRSR